MKKGFYITTPIYYPNANLHMGHAYTTTICDIMARYHRMIGDDTYFLTGADEHTQKVVKAARAAGRDPISYLDDITDNFKALYETLNISYDQFIRTTNKEVHWPGPIHLWNKLVEANAIYKAAYEGLYCVGCESFVTEKELVDGKCADHGTEPERIQEENYFFRLSAYQDVIRKKIESDELRIMPEGRKTEILSFISAGLSDVSFSRPKEKVPFGIPVPGDDTQVMYVWCDALTNYISALGYGRDEHKHFNLFWPADFHVIGKDILRFHAVFWPAMLYAAKVELPKALMVHGMITSGGRKMSKTLGNVIDPNELIEAYGYEAVRYYLAREISPFEDGDLTNEKFHDVYNANLANGLGNLAARILKMASTNLEKPVEPASFEIPKEFKDAFSEFQIKRAADVVWEAIGALDQKIQEQQPFKVVKTDPETGKEMIRALVSDLAHVAILLIPFLPESARKIQDAIRANTMPETLFPRKEM